MTVPALRVYTDGPDAVTADNLNTFVQSCDTADNLRTFPGVPGLSVLLRGLNTINDGRGGLFYWSATSTGPDDAINTIMVYGSAIGAWVRQVNTPSSLTATAGLTALTSTVPIGLCTLTLDQIGIWIVSGSVLFSPTANTTTIAFLNAGLASSPANNTSSHFVATSFTTGSTNSMPTGAAVMVVAVPTLITLEATASFGVSGMQASGLLQAARIGSQ